MSFLSIFKTIGHGLSVAAGVEHQVAPLLKLIPVVGQYVQPLDDIITRIQNGIKTAETMSPVGNGQLKADAVTADLQAGLDLTNSILAIEGKQVAYDPALLKAFIDAQVTAYNAAAALKGSFHTVPVAKPAAG